MGRRMTRERKIAMYKAILSLSTLEECCDFFEDICAVTELRSMEQRYEVACMLKDEKVYTEIMQKTKASSATISRVNRMLNSGTGCLSRVIDRIRAQEGEESPQDEPT